MMSVDSEFAKTLLYLHSSRNTFHSESNQRIPNEQIASRSCVSEKRGTYYAHRAIQPGSTSTPARCNVAIASLFPASVMVLPHFPAGWK